MSPDHRQPEPVQPCDFAAPVSPEGAGALARLQRILVLLAAAATLSAMAVLWRSGHPGWAVLAALTIPALHAIVLAAEFGWMWRVNAAVQGLTPTWRSVLGAWRAECVDALQVFGLWQPFLSRHPPDLLPTDAAGRRGVILVHGFVCNRGLWRRWIAALRQRRVPTIAVNLEPVFGGIDDYTPTVEAAVRRMEAVTGLAPVLVGHSMGGLVLRRWWHGCADIRRAHHLITIGSPHHGTWLARLARAPNTHQMRRGNIWLSDLDAGEPPPRRQRTTCFYSDCDNIVFPADSATLAGADNRLLRGVGHISLARRAEPFAALLARLDDPMEPERPAAEAALA